MHRELSLWQVQLTLRRRLWKTSGKFPVCVCVSEHASAGPVLPRQLRQINCGTHHIYLYSLIVTLEGCDYSKHEAKVWQVFAE